MADDWGTATITPPPQASTPPAAPPPSAGGDWGTATITPPSSGQGQGQPTEDHVDNWLTRHPVMGMPINLLAGIGAGVEETGAGLDKMARKVTGAGGDDALIRAAAKPTEGTAQAVGKVGENIGEFFTGEELLGMLGRTGTMMNAADKLKAATGLANIANKIPMVGKILRIGMDTVRTGMMSGGQELVKTGGDMGDAEESGVLGGATAAALGTAGLAVRGLAELAPVQRMMENVPITALKSQIAKVGGRYLPSDVGNLAPKIADQQQVAAQQVLRNVSAKATGSIIDEINATRSAAAPVSRQLGASAEAQPFTFDLGTTGGTAAHPMSEEAAQAHRDTIEGLLDKFANPSLRKTITPEERAAWNEAHQALYNIEDTVAEGGSMEPAGAQAGGAAASTTNPAKARQWLQDREDLMTRPEWNDLPQAQQEQIQSQANRLRDQLGVYHAGYRQPLQQLDKDAITSQVHTFGHAAGVLRDAVQPVLDQVESFTGDKDAVKNLYTQMTDAQTAISKATTDEAFDSAMDSYQKANQGIQDLVEKHKTLITPEDYQTATRAMGQASKLGALHGVFESMMNGVTWEEATEGGLPRVMTGNARRLQSWLDKPGNTAMLDNLIGKESRFNLKDLTNLMSKVSSNRNTISAAKNIAKLVMAQAGQHPHLFAGGTGAAIGAAAATATGGNAWRGAGEGIAVAEGIRGVMRLAATNPAFGKSFVYAVEHGLDSEHYAPVLAGTVLRYLPQQLTREDQGTQPTPEGGTQ